MNENIKRLYLSEVDRKIAGVCGGIGERFSIDSTIIRVLFLFLLVVTAIVPMMVFYLLAWAVIPHQP
ncbi:MAG: PspC domain-containing protein [Patescibacteria group bacterium]